LMHTKCHKAGILALAPTPCSKCMVRMWKVTKQISSWHFLSTVVNY